MFVEHYISSLIFYIIIVGYDIEVEWKSRLWINIYYYYCIKLFVFLIYKIYFITCTNLKYINTPVLLYFKKGWVILDFKANIPFFITYSTLHPPFYYSLFHFFISSP